MKKVLTLDDLMSFFKSNNYLNFSSKLSGYQLCVHALADGFEMDDGDNNSDNGLILYCKTKAFHLGKNINGSYVSKQAAEKAIKNLANAPVLAYIENFGDEENDDYDFASHEIEIDKDGNLVYLEQQVGNFTSDEPYIEYDSEEEKEFVIARVAIPRTYTKAAEIIEKKGGTKVSVELLINELSWNADISALSLDDFEVQGITLLGRHIDEDIYGVQVEEGMKGAKLEIEDFKEDNNSVVKFCTDDSRRLIESLDRLNDILSNLSIYNSERKEENLMDNEKQLEGMVEAESTNEVVDENLENQFGTESKEFKATEEETTESEETVTEFEDESSESDEGTPDADAVSENEAKKKTKEVEEEEDSMFEDNEENVTVENDNVEDTDNGNESDNTENTENVEDTKKFTVSFELSQEDTRVALYDLIWATYPDNFFSIVATYSDYVILQDWNAVNTYYKQAYTKEDSNIALSGDLIQVYAEFLTATEKDALELMRNTYNTLQDEVTAYKAKEATQEKFEKVVNNSDYSVIKDTEEFNALVNDMDKYTVEEFCVKADLLLARHVKSAGTFAAKKDNSTSIKFLNLFSGEQRESKKNKPYGGIFEDYFNNK